MPEAYSQSAYGCSGDCGGMNLNIKETTESGLKDFSDFIILCSEFELNMSEEIIGFPVYVVSGFLENDFVLSYKYDCDSVRFKAMKAFKEFQELYSLGDNYE